jgi:predicted nucleic acid-binding protein
LKTLLLDANSIMLLTRAGWVLEGYDETNVATTAIASYELGNAVWKDLHLFKRLTEEESRILLTVFHEAMLRLRVEPQLELSERLEVLGNADRLSLSYYDSSYLTAAMRLEATLVTEDKGLTKAAKECGVPTTSAGELMKTR